MLKNMNKDDAELAQYEAMQNYHLHSDRAAIDIGIAGLNTAVLINAGALVAMIALAGQLWDKPNGQILVSKIFNASESFAWGLGYASFDYVIAYFYQSLLTHQAYIALEKLSAPALKISKGWELSSFIMAIIMIALALASVAEFICGVISITNAFQIK